MLAQRHSSIIIYNQEFIKSEIDIIIIKMKIGYSLAYTYCLSEIIMVCNLIKFMKINTNLIN
jgi:hypothetical protein